MADRLTRIYTRSGDRGTTALADGRRVDKYHPRIEAIGDLDELNALLGVLLAELAADDPLLAVLAPLQHDLFDLGGELAMVDEAYRVMDAEAVASLERHLDALNGALPPLQEFILPGGNRASALCQQARAVCRRAERRLVELAGREPVNCHSLGYLNRLSDLLFVCARVLARRQQGREVCWQPRHRRQHSD
ncbi:ATP--cobalamin adenosyltransferase [Marinobacterium nitratireducens]|uniref:Corrinoid adenosyltransferase n=1 Tax=Marinobacterium nitratireducens TaxID=518897 RepID=A0A917ZI37_9GAMM|nr:cob(I)yrinic acid a,c-diamide adenosyltransferase [Marinobacterium nitratireducens]GGO82927.1 ATP--cobalamin adenosyltransferase [Marinobacterium nitratireducens]